MRFKIVSRAVGWWERMPLRRKGIVLALIPLLALLVSASFAFLGNRQRERAETDVARHFELVTNLEELLTLVVNAETGTRGFLLTERVEFLRPYQLASQRLPTKIEQLRALVQSEPGDGPRVEKGLRLSRIEGEVAQEIKALQVLQGRTSSRSNLYQPLKASRDLMDRLREELRLMRVEEKRLLALRIQEIAWVRRRDYLAIGLTLLIGIAGRFLSVYLFNTGVLHRVRRIRANVGRVGQAAPLPFEPSGKDDALGALEREVAATHARLAQPNKAPRDEASRRAESAGSEA